MEDFVSKCSVALIFNLHDELWNRNVQMLTLLHWSNSSSFCSLPIGRCLELQSSSGIATRVVYLSTRPKPLLLQQTQLIILLYQQLAACVVYLHVNTFHKLEVCWSVHSTHTGCNAWQLWHGCTYWILCLIINIIIIKNTLSRHDDRKFGVQCTHKHTSACTNIMYAQLFAPSLQPHHTWLTCHTVR